LKLDPKTTTGDLSPAEESEIRWRRSKKCWVWTRKKKRSRESSNGGLTDPI